MHKSKVMLIAILILGPMGVHAQNSYTTTLSLESPSTDGITTVVFDWSTLAVSGIIGGNDLIDYSISLYAGSSLIYSNDVLINGVRQPLESVDRNDPFWDYDLDTLTLRQFNLGVLGILFSGTVSGTHYSVEDGVSLPADSLIIIWKFIDGSFASRNEAIVSNQFTQSPLPPDCSTPLVSLGEVEAGRQAGFTGGSVLNENTLPSGFFLAVSGVETRGFIDPESGSGYKCDADWGLVSGWLGIQIENSSGTTIRTQREALEAARTLFPVVTFFVDGVERVRVFETQPRIGSLPTLDRRLGAMKSWSTFLHPFSLALGIHTATVVLGRDQDCLPLPGNSQGLPPGVCDGIPDRDFVFSSSFEVVAD